MEHKGYEFSVVLSANPRGWVWSVSAGQWSRKGMEVNRATANLKAQKAIDNLIKVKASADAKPPPMIEVPKQDDADIIQESFVRIAAHATANSAGAFIPSNQPTIDKSQENLKRTPRK